MNSSLNIPQKLCYCSSEIVCLPAIVASGKDITLLRWILRLFGFAIEPHKPENSMRFLLLAAETHGVFTFTWLNAVSYFQ